MLIQVNIVITRRNAYGIIRVIRSLMGDNATMRIMPIIYYKHLLLLLNTSPAVLFGISNLTIGFEPRVLIPGGKL